MKENKYLALYVRTSTAHQKKGSISQQMYLERYCKQNNIENYKIYVDENYSGRLGVRRRPSLEKLISDEKIIETAQMTDLSVRSIAKLHGCSPSSVSRILKKHRTQKPREV